MVEIPSYPIYDADHHIYEPDDAITRHLPKKWAHDFRFVEIDGRKRLALNNHILDFIPNPDFARVAAPGVHVDYYRGQNPDGLSIREITGKPVVPPPAWRYDRDARLAEMDKQQVHAMVLFPTLFTTLERHLSDNHDMLHDTLHSLNEWMDETWGMVYKDRIYSAPVISLADIDRAVEELDWLLKRGARTVNLRTSPVPGYRGGRSPGLKDFDAFWARVAEAKIFISFHGSNTDYDNLITMWTGAGEFEPFKPKPLINCLNIIGRATADTMAALICDGVFDRFPDLRVMSVENGATWVVPLLNRLKMTYGQMPQAFKSDPIETFKRNIFVAPFIEDDWGDLGKTLETNRIVFSSDFPHPEGVAKPIEALENLTAYNEAEKKQIINTNMKGLLEGKRD